MQDEFPHSLLQYLFEFHGIRKKSHRILVFTQLSSLQCLMQIKQCEYVKKKQKNNVGTFKLGKH